MGAIRIMLSDPDKAKVVDDMHEIYGIYGTNLK